MTITGSLPQQRCGATTKNVENWIILQINICLHKHKHTHTHTYKQNRFEFIKSGLEQHKLNKLLLATKSVREYNKAHGKRLLHLCF